MAERHSIHQLSLDIIKTERSYIQYASHGVKSNKFSWKAEQEQNVGEDDIFVIALVS